MLLVVLLLGAGWLVPEAAAQSRERGRSGTTKKARVERQDTKAEARGRQERVSSSKRETRTRPERAARSRTETRSRDVGRQNSRVEVRARRPEPARQQAQPRRTREQERSARQRTGQPDKTERRAQSAERRTDRSRGATRGREARQPEARDGNLRLDAGRTGRSERGGQENRVRRDDRDRPSRQEGRVDRDRRDDRYRRDDYRGQRRTPRYQPRDHWRSHYERDRRYQHKHYKRRHIPKTRVHYRPFVVRPFIHIDIDWPWVHRHRHGWRPRYQYRQVIYVDAGWGGRRHRRAQIDVRTYYYHELRHATSNRAEVDIYVERVEFYENGRYLGEVHHVPEQLGRIRATVYRDGRVDFDRDVFIVGDAYAGFEMVSTRYYDGFVLDAYQRAHGLRVGVVDLRRERVVPASYSRLFDPYDFQGYVPVSLLPDDRGWLLDFGRASFSGVYYDEDPYYYGGYSGYGDDYDDPYYGDDYYEEDYYVDDGGHPHYSVRSTVAEANFGVSVLSKTHDRRYSTSFGANIHLKRETEFVRVK